MPLDETQLQVLQNVISAFIGAGGSMGVQWLAKRKTRFEKSDQHTESLIKASTDTVKASQEVIAMLQSMLDKQEEHFTELIEKAKKSCREQVDELKYDADGRMEDLREDNAALNIRITGLVDENKSLSVELANVNAHNRELDIKISELKRRLSRYEKKNTGELKMVSKKEKGNNGEEDSKDA
jgi:predicted  nucleic acid-binding Zn-ribbon protein